MLLDYGNSSLAVSISNLSDVVPGCLDSSQFSTSLIHAWKIIRFTYLLNTQFKGAITSSCMASHPHLFSPPLLLINGRGFDYILESGRRVIELIGAGMDLDPSAFVDDVDHDVVLFLCDFLYASE